MAGRSVIEQMSLVMIGIRYLKILLWTKKHRPGRERMDAKPGTLRQHHGSKHKNMGVAKKGNYWVQDLGRKDEINYKW